MNDNIFKYTPIFYENVYIHSKPENSLLYDRIWDMQHQAQSEGIETWGPNRVEKLKKLFDNAWLRLDGLTVLDTPCGLGRMSIAALELGAENVYSVDGSFIGPKQTKARDSRIVAVQSNIELMHNLFNDNIFDVIIHYFSLMHLKDYRSVLLLFQKLLKPNGLLAFNFFGKGTTPDITYALRDIFLPLGIDLTIDFLSATGKLNRFSSKVIDIRNLDSIDINNYPKFSNILLSLKQLSKIYSSALLDDRLRLEDLCTTYLHNFDKFEIKIFIERETSLKIIRETHDGFVVQKSF